MKSLLAALLLTPLLAAADDTKALQQRIDEGAGSLVLKAGTYQLGQPLRFDLAKLGAVAIKAEGAVTLIMNGPGPALDFVGTHEGTASPKTFKPETWRERMPSVDGIEILGNHPEADGIRLRRTMQATITRVAVRKARHAIHLVERNRNTLIADCHLYENEGVGVYLDNCNLHQINVANSHISYNRRGGIVVRDGQVRNLQISNCDIEGNMPGDTNTTDTANIFIDLRNNDPQASVAEVAITGCTIQHSAGWSKTGSLAPGGANIRILGRPDYPVDNVAIANNVMSDTSVNVHIDHAKDIVLTGNTFFTPMPADLLVEHSQRVIVNGNVFNPRQDWAVGGIVFRDCQSCLITASTFHAIQDPVAAILLERCVNSRISNCVITETKQGIVLESCKNCLILDCSIDNPAGGGKPVENRNGEGNVTRLLKAP